MDHEIQLISDGDALAVIGDPVAVEGFLVAEGLPSEDLGLPRLGAVLRAGAALAQAGSEIAANSGRWVKLTPESAQRVKKYGLRKSSETGLSTGVLKGDSGQIKGFVEFVGPGSLLTNPAVLAGVAGIMAQLAMQQTMDEIIDYLATIDEKLDDVLRAQEDAVWADMIGVGFDIDEAMTIREHTGRVSEVTWSKMHGAPGTIARTQAYALRQLDGLTEELERSTKIGDLAKTAKEAQSKVQGWLVVLARCFQLQDAIAVLELDRVLDASPDDLNGHRLGLKASRQKRLDAIAQTTARLMAAWTRPRAPPTQRCCCTRRRPRRSCNRGTTSRAPWPTSTGDSGSSPARIRWRQGDGWPRPPSSGTRCSRPAPSASTSPSASATRPSTGPDRCRGGSQPASPSERTAAAPGSPRKAQSKDPPRRTALRQRLPYVQRSTSEPATKEAACPSRQAQPMTPKRTSCAPPWSTASPPCTNGSA
jgi:hypothetical protein